MSKKLRAKCEYVVDFGLPGDKKVIFCNKPTVAGYPAMGGGWMACCEEHVAPHRAYVRSVEEIRAMEAARVR